MVNLGVRFLDDVVDVNHYPLPFISQATLNNRRIGLGIMGWAESLIALAFHTDSEAAVAKAEQLMSFIQEVAHKASQELAAAKEALFQTGVLVHGATKESRCAMRL